ncbi:MAG: protein translocase SEC61 complex subunit gamma [Candidatus Parvarchaeota archaeon]|nr:protein translocase SEC61 complex subunit gamma [Candidatus Parvarchaeota archaeon]
MDEKKSLADANIGREENAPTASEQPKENKVQQPVNAENQAQKQAEQPAKEHVKHEEPFKRERRRLHLTRTLSKVKLLHPLNIKRKVSHYIVEYSRVLHLARKPTKTEYKELAIMVIVGTSIIGVIGFIVQMIIQFI